MINEKSARNKTIAISVEDGRQYLEKCITVNESVELSDILGKTILGDCFEVMTIRFFSVTFSTITI